MTPEKAPLPLDARLLAETVIELNISRRNVGIYPQGHPSVDRSIARAHEHLERLFELRPEITLAVAKDTLVIDTSSLDRKNPVFREFALHLNRLGIASLTFRAGLSKDELYRFHHTLVSAGGTAAGPELAPLLEKAGVTHLLLGYVDYSGFVFREGETGAEGSGAGLWERYVQGLIEGKLAVDDQAAAFPDLPPETLAQVVNASRPEDLKEEAYDRVITTYIRRSSERLYSGRDLAKILDFVGGLKPELKRQFLSSALKLVSSDLAAAERALSGVEVERVLDMLSAINQQKLLIPEALRNLIVKLSKFVDAVPEDRFYRGSLLADDHVIPPEVVELLGSGSFSNFVTESYQAELQRLMRFDAAQAIFDKSDDILRECGEELLERDFAALLGELICSDVVPEEDYRSFVDLMVQEAEGVLATGGYEHVLTSIGLLELNAREGRHPEATAAGLGRFREPAFVQKLVDSLAVFGRQRREEARALCARYGERLLPGLVEALIAERSQAVRRYLIGLIAGYGTAATPEVVGRLGDPRWFVQRNMVFLLSECDPAGALAQVRPLCESGNPKVSFEAIRYVIRAGDPSGVPPLLAHLHGGDRANVEQAIAAAGALKVREAVPHLLQMLAKKAVSGADLLERLPVVKALGEIADERAVPALREAAAAKSLFFRGAVERVRDEVFLSLKRFPLAAVRDLVEEGARSRNDRVREECRRRLEGDRG